MFYSTSKLSSPNKYFLNMMQYWNQHLEIAIQGELSTMVCIPWDLYTVIARLWVAPMQKSKPQKWFSHSKV